MTKIFDRNNIDKIIKGFYKQNNITPKPYEFDYLKNGFNGINSLWLCNYRKIERIKYLMISEAPLWGQDKKYIYNPKPNNSQFFHRNDLEVILNLEIPTKKDFISTCNKIGLLIIDISPYPLNSIDTSINYGKSENNSKKLSKSLYKQLISQTLDDYFLKKIDLISKKKSDEIITFFRYERVKNTFIDIISDILKSNKLITNADDIKDISQNGGGVNRIKLCHILHNDKCPNKIF